MCLREDILSASEKPAISDCDTLLRKPKKPSDTLPHKIDARQMDRMLSEHADSDIDLGGTAAPELPGFECPRPAIGDRIRWKETSWNSTKAY